jgi:hypothetical protein
VSTVFEFSTYPKYIESMLTNKVPELQVVQLESATIVLLKSLAKVIVSV